MPPLPLALQRCRSLHSIPCRAGALPRWSAHARGTATSRRPRAIASQELLPWPPSGSSLLCRAKPYPHWRWTDPGGPVTDPASLAFLPLTGVPLVARRHRWNLPDLLLARRSHASSRPLLVNGYAGARSQTPPSTTTPTTLESEDQSRVSKKTKKPKKISGHDLTPASILRNEENVINLSSDEDLADDALEMLIKSKQEAEIFKDLPLFDADILNHFIDEWFEDPTINIDDL
ncbi:uncharacterized protein LOC125554768 [Triticum urartu]|uniref:uncharacterized protein LOC125554768 n=1 Tax=Triticum urartu TaxID=4572 RepID=UPI002043FA58|nr:uncharacterized protein LOC125554768 [Triticum urartu]